MDEARRIALDMAMLFTRPMVMAPRQRKTFRPVTLGHIREHGCRNLLVYCTSGWCHRSTVVNADWSPDDTPARSLCSRMVCTACGLIH